MSPARNVWVDGDKDAFKREYGVSYDETVGDADYFVDEFLEKMDCNVPENEASIAEKWTLSGMFQDGCKPVEVSGGSRLSGQNKFLLHRCDPEKLCICDFIGWKEIEAKND